MLVMPIWMIKYALVLVGFGFFFEQGSISALLVGCASLAWCIHSWRNHRK